MSIQEKGDDYFMKMAMVQAQQAFDRDEVPVGVVVVCKGQIIARGHNLTEALNDVTAHAEMQAITAAADYLGGKYLRDCAMYVTLEPCQMCAGALYWAQLSKLVIGASDEKRGYRAMGAQLHPKTEVTFGIMEAECSQILKEFFLKKR